MARSCYLCPPNEPRAPPEFPPPLGAPPLSGREVPDGELKVGLGCLCAEREPPNEGRVPEDGR